MEQDVYEKVYAYEEAHLKEVISALKEEINRLRDDGFEYENVDFYDDVAVGEVEDRTIKHNDARAAADIIEKNLASPYFARMLLKQTGSSTDAATPSYTKRRTLFREEEGEEEIDMYVGRELLIANGKVIVFSHNSELGNRVYDRINGTIEYNGFTYEVQLRRKFDISDGVLNEVFQDFSKEEGAMVYDKFLARMLEKKRGEKYLTDIIPTIQANQNAIITRPADENAVVQGCAGSGKTMILMQRLEYLNFNRKIDLDDVIFVAPSKAFLAHVQPVIQSLRLSSVKRQTTGELYYSLACALNRGLEHKDNVQIYPDSEFDRETVKYVYSDEFKSAIRRACNPLIRDINKRLTLHRQRVRAYEEELAACNGNPRLVTISKPEQFKYPLTIFNHAFDEIRPKCFSKALVTKCTAYATLLVNRFCIANKLPPVLLFIDEAQDLFKNELELLKSVFSNVMFNLYGDVHQRIYTDCGLSDWSEVKSVFDYEYYTLDENYRNAYEITEYCNTEFGFSASALGLKGGEVRFVNPDEAPDLLNIDGRTAVIVSAFRSSPVPDVLKDFQLYTAEQAKGMEFERVVVLTENMTKSERYVSFTRALDKLLIINEN